MQHPTMIYIASPYSVQEGEDSFIAYDRYTKVTEYATHLFKEGQIFFAPITFCHYWARDNELPTDAETWKSFNKHYMNLCTELHVLMLPGWKTSKGVQHEIEYFTKQNKPVKYIVYGYREIQVNYARS